MSIPGDVFEPIVIRNILKNLQKGASEQKLFEKKWEENVCLSVKEVPAKFLLTKTPFQIQHQVESWKKNRDNQSKHGLQLQWEAVVVEYVNYIHHKTSVHGNKSSSTAPPPLKKDVPLLGPCFLPPLYYHTMKRETTLKIIPDTAYIKPLMIIHPVYYCGFGLSQCPQCDSKDILWDGWTATGACDVNGVHHEE